MGGYPFIAGWFISWKIRKEQMDENWGYPHFRRPPYYITYDHYVFGA